MKKTLLVLLSMIFSFNAYLSSQSVVYVASGGSGDGTSWSSALGNIQTAISAANALDPKGEVWVKAGTYTVTTTIAVSQGVNMYGGFAGTETSKDDRAKKEDGESWDFSNESILDGRKTVRSIESRGNFTTETIVDGFTITNGNAVSTSANNTGGGVLIRPGLKVQHCVIKNNVAASGGGGGVSMTGGTLYASYVYRNTQSNNANGGGGIYVNAASGFEAIIEGCTIENNTSDVRGAGLNVQGAGFTKMINLRIFNNVAEGKPGGAMYQNTANNSTVNSLIYNNTGTSAIYLRGSLLNSTVVNNVGGVYYAESSAAVEFINNIIWGCATDVTGAQATSLSGVANAKAVVENNATYNPIPSDKNWTTANNILFSSNNSNGDVENPAEGTVGSGPKFTKVSTFKGAAQADEEILILDSVNWSLQVGSPAIDTGKTLTSVTTDILGQARPLGTAFDLGAYEHDPTSTGIAKNEFIYSVYSKERQIIISGFENPVEVSVYSVSGQSIYRTKVTSSYIEIPANRGIYIVRVNDAATKVLVK